MTDDELAVLRRDVQHLQDRAAILDCIAAHARGCDRHDVEILAGTYLDDGIDVHGTTVNVGAEYATWANDVHAATSSNHLHNVTTHTCEINGDEAHAESYVLVTLLSPDGSTATVMCGRYDLVALAVEEAAGEAPHHRVVVADHGRRCWVQGVVSVPHGPPRSAGDAPIRGFRHPIGCTESWLDDRDRGRHRWGSRAG